MAEKRMYSKKITDSDDFIQMPASSQALYFHLNQGADDDGFNNQIQIAMLKAHASIDDLKVLMTKNFIMRFESGVVVVKHWWIHNTLRKDRYTPTNFQEELKLLGIKENKSYTFGKNQCRLPNGCQMVAIDKNREEKNSIVENNIVSNINKEPTPFDTFIKKYNITCDNYSTQLGEMDFALLDKAYAESKWLQDNFVCLSQVCKNYNKIIGGAFKDFMKPKKAKSFGFSGQRKIDDLDTQFLVVNPDDVEV
jgi:hypothetical protein